MLFARSDIPFAADDTHRFVPWLIGVMACLCALFLCLSISVGGWIVERHDRASGSFSVNIPAHTEALPDKINKIRDILAKTPGVSHIKQLDDDALKAMLKPWLGSNDALSGLPLPAVLDVTLDAKTNLDYADLEKNLAAVAPGTEVDAHALWVAAFSDFSIAVQCLIVILAILVFAAMGAMIAFTALASLKLHAKTVHLLHAIGAEDNYIARQFQAEAFRLTLPGAAGGCLLAGLIYTALALYISALPASLMPSLGITTSHLILLFAMPLGCAITAQIVAYISVKRQLQHAL